MSAPTWGKPDDASEQRRRALALELAKGSSNTGPMSRYQDAAIGVDKIFAGIREMKARERENLVAKYTGEANGIPSGAVTPAKPPEKKNATTPVTGGRKLNDVSNVVTGKFERGEPIRLADAPPADALAPKITEAVTPDHVVRTMTRPRSMPIVAPAAEGGSPPEAKPIAAAPLASVSDIPGYPTDAQSFAPAIAAPARAPIMAPAAKKGIPPEAKPIDAAPLASIPGYPTDALSFAPSFAPSVDEAGMRLDQNGAQSVDEAGMRLDQNGAQSVDEAGMRLDQNGAQSVDEAGMRLAAVEASPRQSAEVLGANKINGAVDRMFGIGGQKIAPSKLADAIDPPKDGTNLDASYSDYGDTPNNAYRRNMAFGRGTPISPGVVQARTPLDQNGAQSVDEAGMRLADAIDPPKKEDSQLSGGMPGGEIDPRLDAFSPQNMLRPSAQGTTEKPQASDTSGKPLGYITAKYESGGNYGAGGPDNHGWSYGKYQFNSRGSLNEFMRSNPGIAAKFAGLNPESQAFAQRWRQVNKEMGPDFGAAQDATFQRRAEPYFEKARSLGYNTDDRGIKEAILSGSIQHGKFNNVLAGGARAPGFAGQSPEDQLRSFYAARTNYTNGLPDDKLSPEWKRNLQGRYQSELRDTIAASRMPTEQSNITPVQQADTGGPTGGDMQPWRVASLGGDMPMPRQQQAAPPPESAAVRDSLGLSQQVASAEPPVQTAQNAGALNMPQSMFSPTPMNQSQQQAPQQVAPKQYGSPNLITAKDPVIAEKAAQQAKEAQDQMSHWARVYNDPSSSPDIKLWAAQNYGTAKQAHDTATMPVSTITTEGGRSTQLIKYTDGSVESRDVSSPEQRKDKRTNVDLGTHFGVWDPQLEKIVATLPKDLLGAKREEEQGKAISDAITAYRDMQTKMPSLEKVVVSLNDLSNKATYTTAGKLWNEARRELGYEPREAAVARTSYIATIDNEILPLLRGTFGAQFTVKEGETLRATLGDPDKTPIEKQAVLSAYIEQKRRQVEGMYQKAIQMQPPQPGTTAPISGPPEETKVLSGKTYIRHGNQWYEK